MTLHPILALDHVIDEYRDYLRTEFRAKDKALRAALERELDQPLFLANHFIRGAFVTEHHHHSGARVRVLHLGCNLHVGDSA